MGGETRNIRSDQKIATDGISRANFGARVAPDGCSGGFQASFSRSALGATTGEGARGGGAGTPTAVRDARGAVAGRRTSSVAPVCVSSANFTRAWAAAGRGGEGCWMRARRVVRDLVRGRKRLGARPASRGGARERARTRARTRATRTRRHAPVVAARRSASFVLARRVRRRGALTQRTRGFGGDVRRSRGKREGGTARAPASSRPSAPAIAAVDARTSSPRGVAAARANASSAATERCVGGASDGSLPEEGLGFWCTAVDIATVPAKWTAERASQRRANRATSRRRPRVRSLGTRSAARRSRVSCSAFARAVLDVRARGMLCAGERSSRHRRSARYLLAERKLRNWRVIARARCRYGQTVRRSRCKRHPIPSTSPERPSSDRTNRWYDCHQILRARDWRLRTRTDSDGSRKTPLTPSR